MKERWIALALLGALASGPGGCASGKGPGQDAGGVDGGLDGGGVDAGPPPACTTAADCDDGVPCTVDTCDPVADACANEVDDSRCEPTELCEAERGCQLRPPCSSDETCDDGDFCNGTETCDPALGCQRGVAPACDDGLGCTVDACDPEAGACTHTPDDAPCSNGIVCDGVETCAPGDGGADANGCLAGAAPDCDDGVPCTRDACTESAGGCESVPDDAACGDGVFCDGAEVCDPLAGCIEGAPPDCDDGVSCTLDVCDPAANACTHTPDDAPCRDGDVCDGQERCDAALGCVEGTAIDCSDGLACTTDRCSGAGMCEHLGSDADGDGFEAEGCGSGDDCDDLVGAVNPGAAEVCDGIDNDCSGGADDGPGMECVRGSAPIACTTSCSTAGASACSAACGRAPCRAATETCNDCDDDEDSRVDEGFTCRRGASSACVTSCGTAGSQSCRADCSGYSTCQASTETCNDCDDDEDSRVDEGFTCRRGVTEGCVSSCGTSGTRTCALDCSGFGACVASEVCNGCDDDGDGTADEGFACRLGQSASCTTACGTSGTQQCDGTCSGFGACRAPSETCGNGCDDDGNGMVDDGCGPPNAVCTGATVLSGSSGTRTDPYADASRTVTDCGAGGELWYRITLGERRVLYLDTLGSTFNTRISIRTSCGGAAAQCEDDDCGTLQEQLVRALDAGTYYVAVHAHDSGTTSGTINLRWQTVAAGNGAYARVTANGTYTGTTAGTGVLQPSCTASTSGPEDGWYFTVCPSTSRTVTADTCAGTIFDTMLSVQGVGGELACNDDSCGLQSSTSAAVTGPGVFVIQVDGWNGSSGGYGLLVGGL